MTEPFIAYAIKVDQPIGSFYVSAIRPSELKKISYVDVRDFQDGNASEIDGIQRKLSNSRVNKIRNYVTYPYATFPTSIVVAIEDRCAEITPVPDVFGLYKIVVDAYVDETEPSENISIGKAARIIDGQHRLAGLEALEDDKEFEVNLSMFIGITKADEAEIFSTVNLAQTRVNNSLVLDLYDYQKKRSTYKSAHWVAVALDSAVDSPFHGKIKRIGIAHPDREPGSETLSQATIVRGLLRHFPGDPDKEKSKGFLENWSIRTENENWKKNIFSEFYRSSNDKAIYQTTRNYFQAIAEKWTSVWYDSQASYILNRTNGYNAFIRYLKDAYLHLLKDEETPRIVTKKEFASLLEKIDLKASDFVTDNYKPGSSGAAELYKDLIKRSPF